MGLNQNLSATFNYRFSSSKKTHLPEMHWRDWRGLRCWRCQTFPCGSLQDVSLRSLLSFPCKWVTRIITLFIGVITPFIASDGGPSCTHFHDFRIYNTMYPKKSPLPAKTSFLFKLIAIFWVFNTFSAETLHGTYGKSSDIHSFVAKKNCDYIKSTKDGAKVSFLGTAPKSPFITNL